MTPLKFSEWFEKKMNSRPASQMGKVLEYNCENCGKKLRQRINYCGPIPPGAYRCPYCEKNVRIR